MTLFYDPQTRKPKPWVFAALIALPIILLILGYFYGKQYAAIKNQEGKTAVQEDIFK